LPIKCPFVRPCPCAHRVCIHYIYNSWHANWPIVLQLYYPLQRMAVAGSCRRWNDVQSYNYKSNENVSAQKLNNNTSSMLDDNGKTGVPCHIQLFWRKRLLDHFTISVEHRRRASLLLQHLSCCPKQSSHFILCYCSVCVPIHLHLTCRSPLWPSALYILCAQFYCIHYLVRFANYTFFS
jgi:hypothetical protein